MAGNFMQEELHLNTLQGALHSPITIHRFVEEELRHDQYLIQTSDNAGLSTMSSGQQKKALLMYLIEQKPQYLVLDDVYGNMDIETQQFITGKLSELSQSMFIIQVFFRRQDLLPFIDRVFCIDGNNEIINTQDSETFLANNQTEEINPLHQFSLPKEYEVNTSEQNVLVQLNSVSVRYVDKQVLENINWTIEPGEFWQLKGPNGSGKDRKSVV